LGLCFAGLIIFAGFNVMAYHSPCMLQKSCIDSSDDACCWYWHTLIC